VEKGEVNTPQYNSNAPLSSYSMHIRSTYMYTCRMDESGSPINASRLVAPALGHSAGATSASASASASASTASSHARRASASTLLPAYEAELSRRGAELDSLRYGYCFHTCPSTAATNLGGAGLSTPSQPHAATSCALQRSARPRWKRSWRRRRQHT
jgi:hypothetical protein